MGHVIHGSNGDDQGPLLNRVSITQYIIAVVVVAIRFLTRIFIVRKFGLDDWFMTVAVILGAAQTATIILQVENGRGKHTSELHLEQYNIMLMWKWVNMLLYYLANWAVKMSILALYYRIGHGQKGLPWILRPPVIWTMASFMTAFTITVCLIQVFTCIPISRAWNAEMMGEDCIDPAVFAKVQGGINVFTDLALLMFPIPLLRVLKINKKQRTSLFIIFSIGLVPLVASVLRLCEIFMSSTIKFVSWKVSDTSWTWAWVPVWSQIEVDVGIVAASLPSLNPLIQRVWTGFAATRAASPDQTPTLKPEGGWGNHSPWKDTGSTLNSSTDAKRASWYRPGRDEEESDSEDEKTPGGEFVEVATAKTVNVRVAWPEYAMRNVPDGR